MAELNDLIAKMQDIQRRVNSFKNLDPLDIMIQYEKIYPKLEEVKTEITAQATNKALETGQLSTSDILQLVTVMQLQTDTKIELCFSILKTLLKNVSDRKNN